MHNTANLNTTLYTFNIHIYQGELLANDVPAVKVMALTGHYSINITLSSYVNRSALEGSQALAKIS